MSDFWTPKRGYKVYQNRPLSRKIFNKKCPEECEWRMSDGNCDQDCNLLACIWDGDDCDGIAPDGGENLRRGLFILTGVVGRPLVNNPITVDQRFTNRLIL